MNKKQTKFVIYLAKFTFQINVTNFIKNNRMIKNSERMNLNEKANKQIDITFQNISYEVSIESSKLCCLLPCLKTQKLKTILHNVEGIAKSGQTTVIMGPSGAGKTSLLNILASRIPFKKNSQSNISGKVYANDLQYTYDDFGGFANYVMQDDILLQTLTVRETLQYVAQLRIFRPEHQRQQKVEELIRNLKLQKCADTLVGGSIIKGISGGQRKRTSIAVQLINDPIVIFLDEPTSGLDSLTSYIICRYLKKLAKEQRKTIIMTIHQPNSQIFSLFDRLILLAQGKIAYQGCAKKALDYFEEMGFICPKFSNPPDYFMSILHPQSSENEKNFKIFLDNYKTKLLPIVKNELKNKNIEIPEKNINSVPFCQSLSALLKKDILNAKRNPLGSITSLIQSIFIALFLGGLYFNLDKNYQPYNSLMNNLNFSLLTGLFFIIGMMGLLISLTPIALLFTNQKFSFYKESGSNLYSTGTYFLSKNIIELIFILLIPLIMTLIFYWMIGLATTAAQFFTFYLTFLLIIFIGNSLGFLLGSIGDDDKTITHLIPIFVVPFILFSGYLKNRQQLPGWIGWLEYISPLKYSFNGFVQNQTLTTDSPIELLNFQLNRWECIFVLIGMSIVIRLIALFCLWFNKKKLK